MRNAYIFENNLLDTFRKSGTENGENIWEGERYELPVNSARVQGFVLNSEGLCKNIMGKGPELIAPIKTTEKLKKFERDFLPIPIGKKLLMRIENAGMVKILTTNNSPTIFKAMSLCGL